MLHQKKKNETYGEEERERGKPWDVQDANKYSYIAPLRSRIFYAIERPFCLSALRAFHSSRDFDNNHYIASVMPGLETRLEI